MIPEEETGDVAEWLAHVAPELVEDHARLARLLVLLDRFQGERWNRHVSSADSITDRWERARRRGFGEGASVYDSALILGDVRVGRDTWIGPGTILDGSGGLTIGDTCSISAGVQLYSHDSVLWTVSGGRAEVERRPTAIGSSTYLGPNSIVTMGVSVGTRCIVGASSLVNDDIPDGHVAWGTPARVVEETDAFLARKASAL
jgi:acetyltransferase-like isoleucine patch superfamily enzyme